MKSVRAIIEAGEPVDDDMARRLALRATKWIPDDGLAEQLSIELANALGDRAAALDVLARIENASRRN